MIEIFQNIRQLYTFAPPCKELLPYIEFFSETNLEETKAHAGNQLFSVKMFASWTPTFYINLGSPYLISSGNQQYQISANTDVLILRDSIVERKNLPTDNIFTVKFHPGGLESVLNIKQSKCVNKLILLQHILPHQLLVDIKKPQSFEQRTTLMESYLLQHFHRNPSEDHYLKLVHKAIGTYSENGLQLSTDEVAERIFLTSKTINRYFHRVIGISPKRYFSILRARTALTAYVANQKTFSPMAFGYYDLSHFGKNIVQFTCTKLSEIE